MGLLIFILLEASFTRIKIKKAQHFVPVFGFAEGEGLAALIPIWEVAMK